MKFFKCLASKNTQIQVNGVSYEGKNIVVTKDGDVIVDGSLKTSNTIVNITVFGDVDTLHQGSGKTIITGNAHNVSTGSGDIRIENNVTGNISTGSGDVTVSGNIGGNVRTGSGDVNVR